MKNHPKVVLVILSGPGGIDQDRGCLILVNIYKNQFSLIHLGAQMRHFQKFILTSALTLIASLSFAQSAPNIEKIKSLIEGSYNLVEWVDGDTQLSPPAVSARFIIKDGIVTWIANKSVGGDQLSFSGIGAYKITPTTFSYGYSAYAIANRTNGVSDVKLQEAGSPDMILPKMRAFDLVNMGKDIKAINGERFWLFSEDGMTYSDPISKNKRVYKRVVSEKN